MPKSILIKELKGHSGCIIELRQDTRRLFVRKYSADPKYDARLKAQKDKCLILKNLKLPLPHILNEGYVEDRYYIDMEFVRGIQLSKFLEQATVAEIQLILPQISSAFNILQLAGSSSYEDQSKNFLDKLNSLSSNCDPIENGSVQQAINYLQTVNWAQIPFTPCHGDLTYENILVCDHKVHFIDTLDSFADSWIIDAAKLLQDPEVLWAYRHENISQTLNVRLHFLKSALLDGFREANKNVPSLIYSTLLLNTLRIIPYTNETKDKYFLYKAVEKIMNRIPQYMA